VGDESRLSTKGPSGGIATGTKNPHYTLLKEKDCKKFKIRKANTHAGKHPLRIRRNEKVAFFRKRDCPMSTWNAGHTVERRGKSKGFGYGVTEGRVRERGEKCKGRGSAGQFKGDEEGG